MDNATHRFSVALSFQGDLGFFLRQQNKAELVIRVLSHKSSVKDVIESCGVPHPEVDLLICNGRPVDFSFQLNADATLEVYPVAPELFPASRLQERGVHTFVADCHLGKLARELRLLGVDVSYRHDATDQQLLETMVKENRALLTRDRTLLMHRVVRNGYFPRSQDSIEQTVEVVRRFELAERLTPFVRCLRCNGLLTKVPKESVLEQLEPLTRLYYHDFQRCSQCGRPYWRGSHIDRLTNRAESILQRISAP
ncbi:MAG TPA: Mut7-C RNAse domain-containing protein [Chthoniobacterales bacterium]|nr:Mut7-C RNAse domain-containing protein [Chthoniobacterales bacterium]